MEGGDACAACIPEDPLALALRSQSRSVAQALTMRAFGVSYHSGVITQPSHAVLRVGPFVPEPFLVGPLFTARMDERHHGIWTLIHKMDLAADGKAPLDRVLATVSTVSHCCSVTFVCVLSPFLCLPAPETRKYCCKLSTQRL